jgi:hypothetical protein
MIDATTHTRKIWRLHFDGADSTNLDARRRIRHIRANEALAPSSLVPKIMRSCVKNVFSHSVRK